jgi:hypothetical protein
MRTLVYDKAASAVLDILWQDPAFRDFFHRRGMALGDLGPLIPTVFAPAYLDVKRSLPGGELELLEAQIADDLLVPLADRPTFRAMWESWDQPTRAAFLREQSELKLAERLAQVHDRQLADAFRQAFRAYRGE